MAGRATAEIIHGGARPGGRIRLHPMLLGLAMAAMAAACTSGAAAPPAGAPVADPTGTAASLRQAQRALMDERDTSHPYYWSGFAVIGDGAMPVIRQAPTRTAAAY